MTSKNSETPNANEPLRWTRAIWMGVLVIAMGTIPVSLVASALRLPAYLIVWADVTAIAFFLLTVLIRGAREGNRITVRRMTTFFAVIPGAAALAGVVMIAVGLPLQAILYGFSSIILLANWIYWTRFDRRGR